MIIPSRSLRLLLMTRLFYHFSVTAAT
jgi:hypothetical protein